jgi:DNA gyrase subunit A
VRTSDKAGKVVAIREVLPGDELMVITRNGVVNRQSVDGIRVIGRNTQGVRLINLGPKDMVMDVAKVVREEELDEDGQPIIAETGLLEEIDPDEAPPEE